MGVGGLHTPREYDGRLPPDAGYCLDLVIPRKEGPPKKITCMFEQHHGRTQKYSDQITCNLFYDHQQIHQ